MEKTKNCQKSGHVYNFLQDQEMENKQTAWVFYCKRCLDIRLITKSISWEHLD